MLRLQRFRPKNLGAGGQVPVLLSGPTPFFMDGILTLHATTDIDAKVGFRMGVNGGSAGVYGNWMNDPTYEKIHSFFVGPEDDNLALNDTRHFQMRFTGIEGGQFVTGDYAVTLTVVGATGLTLTGPNSGLIGVESAPFVIGVTGGAISGTIVATPNYDTGTGTFNPTSRNLTSGSPTGSFTFTPTSLGNRNINVSNDRGLATPPNVAYNATAVVSPVNFLNKQAGATPWPPGTAPADMNITIPANTNGLLLISIGGFGGPPSAPHLNPAGANIAATLVPGSQNTRGGVGGATGFMANFYILNPPAGAGVLRFTGATFEGVDVQYFDNVFQVGPFGQIHADNGILTGASVAGSVMASDATKMIAISALLIEGAGLTCDQTFDCTTTEGNGYNGASLVVAHGAGSSAMVPKFNNNLGQDYGWLINAIELIPT